MSRRKLKPHPPLPPAPPVDMRKGRKHQQPQQQPPIPDQLPAPAQVPGSRNFPGGPIHGASTTLLPEQLRSRLEEHPEMGPDPDPAGTRLWKSQDIPLPPAQFQDAGYQDQGYQDQDKGYQQPSDPGSDWQVTTGEHLQGSQDPQGSQGSPYPAAPSYEVDVPAPNAAEQPTGKLSVFFASHGGTGASMLACNAAVALSQTGRSVAVVDLDLQLGDVLTMLGLEPRCPMSKLAREMGGYDWEVLGPMLARHKSGVCVVSQVGCLEELNELNVARIPELLRYLQTHFDYVLVDGVRDFNDHALATMDIADQIVIVVTQDVPAVRGVSRRLAIFRRLGYPMTKVRVVANRYTKDNPITLRAIAKAIGIEPTFTINNDFATVHRAITEGVALSQVSPQATVTQQVHAMAGALFDLRGAVSSHAVAAPVGRQRKKSIFGRLLGKKKR